MDTTRSSVLLGLALLVGLTGCSGTTATPVVLPSPPVIVAEIAFADALDIPSSQTVRDPSDPEEVVRFALMLAEQGAHQRAGRFFLEAVDLPRADSVDNRLRNAALSAAASCFLQAGDIDAFHQTVTRLRGQLNRFRMAALPPELALLLLVDTTEHPRPMRTSQRAMLLSTLPRPVTIESS